RGNGAGLRERRGDVPAIRLPAAVPLLVGARARTTRAARRGAGTAAARAHRLHELVLRAAREPTPDAGESGSRAGPPGVIPGAFATTAARQRAAAQRRP